MSGKLTSIKQSKIEEMKLIEMSPYVHKDRLWRHETLNESRCTYLKHLKFKVEILTCIIKIPKVSISMGGGGLFNITIRVTKLVKY